MVSSGIIFFILAGINKKSLKKSKTNLRKSNQFQKKKAADEAALTNDHNVYLL